MKHVPEFISQLFCWLQYVPTYFKSPKPKQTVTLTRELMPLCPLNKGHKLRIEGNSYFCLLCTNHYKYEQLILPHLPTSCSNCKHDLSEHRSDPYIARVWRCAGDDGWCGCGSYEQNKEI